MYLCVNFSFSHMFVSSQQIVMIPCDRRIEKQNEKKKWNKKKYCSILSEILYLLYGLIASANV